MLILLTSALRAMWQTFYVSKKSFMTKMKHEKMKSMYLILAGFCSLELVFR